MSDIWSYINDGDVYRTEKQHSKAIANYDKATEIDPTLPVPHFHKHATYLDMMNEAIDSDSKANYAKLAKEAMSEYHRLLDAKRAKGFK